MTPKVKTWVAFDAELKFGEGRARLLELIDRHGSLQKAADVLRAAGGGPQSGMRLTKEARDFLGRYWKFRAGVERSAARHFAQAFGAARSARRKAR